ncbi:hypothetical protein [Streptomyces sp. NBC_00059]|nr:hypothetical protein [Streptomyces sp. NBC_00059]MCX5415942.1 hypothetical protein [Streptomyces sp. NBC_00059]
MRTWVDGPLTGGSAVNRPVVDNGASWCVAPRLDEEGADRTSSRSWMRPA